MGKWEYLHADMAYRSPYHIINFCIRYIYFARLFNACLRIRRCAIPHCQAFPSLTPCNQFGIIPLYYLYTHVNSFHTAKHLMVIIEQMGNCHLRGERPSDFPRSATGSRIPHRGFCGRIPNKDAQYDGPYTLRHAGHCQFGERPSLPTGDVGHPMDFLPQW